MGSNESIGGYFELESNNFASIYHNKAIAVNTGRNALEYILLVNDYKKLFIPYYTCYVTLQPITKLNIEFEFYHLDDEFNPIIDSIKNDEAILYVNYYGIMNKVIDSLRLKFKNLIVDNAQAFYAEPIRGIPTFYSSRKFFGLPDGGFVYPNKRKLLKMDLDRSCDRISHLIIHVDCGIEAGYHLFQANDLKLDNLPLRKMSNLTKKLMYNINFNLVREKRNSNFSTLHQELKHKNQLTRIIEEQDINGAMVYPYLNRENDKLRNKLIKNRIFVAKYWPNVIDWLGDKECLELFLLNYLIPLPIDQRYGEIEMERILSLV